MNKTAQGLGTDGAGKRGQGKAENDALKKGRGSFLLKHLCRNDADGRP